MNFALLAMVTFVMGMSEAVAFDGDSPQLELGTYVKDEPPTEKDLEFKSYCAVEVTEGAQSPPTPEQPHCDGLNYYFVPDPRYPDACWTDSFGPYPVCTKVFSTTSFVDLRCPRKDGDLSECTHYHLHK